MKDPCGKCDYRYIVRPAIAALHQQATIPAACRACARRAMAERDKLARDKAKLEGLIVEAAPVIYSGTEVRLLCIGLSKPGWMESENGLSIQRQCDKLDAVLPKLRAEAARIGRAS